MRHPVDYAPSQDYGDNPTRSLPASHWIIQTFGNYQPDGHTGVDYPCPIGTPVRAAADGVVRHVGRFGGGYADNPWWIMPSFAGYTYVVDHGHFIGIYGHCQDGGARVRVGQQVIEAQVLGMSGNTGASTGPHLHFETLPDGYILNSAMYGRINPLSLFGGITPQGTTTTPIQTEEDDMPSIEEIFDYPIARRGGSLGGETNLRSVIAYFDANVEGTRNIVKESAGAAVAAIFTTEFARQGGPGGLTNLAAVIAYLDANLNKLDADQIIDPEAVRAAVSAATEAALKDISITLTTEG